MVPQTDNNNDNNNNNNNNSHHPLAKTSSDGVVAIPIDFDVASKIEGDESQIVIIEIEPNQIVRAESGAMLYMTHGIHMETTTAGGLSAGFKRMLTGQNLMISDFSYQGDPGTKGEVALGTDFPSKIIRINVQDYGGKIICQKGALLCASHTIDIEMEFAKKFTAGFFGGEGFVLQSLTGEGDVFVKAGGTLIQKVLKEGEVLRVSSGCLVAFQEGVEFDVQTIPGFKNVVFGGEGLFVTTLTGPGTVWLQGMPPDRMINEIARRVPSGGGLGFGIPIGMGGGGGGDTGSDAGGDAAAVGEGGTEAGDGDGGEALSEAEAAIQADRNATVATSSMMDDPDSPSALFGDAAAPGTETSSSSPSDNNDVNMEDTTFSSGYDEPTSFTTDEEPPPLDDFEDSSFSTENDAKSLASDWEQQQKSEWDDFQEDETSFDSYDAEESSSDMSAGGEDSGSSLLGSLWDLFTGGDD